jgi:hypothetical protein
LQCAQQDAVRARAFAPSPKKLNECGDSVAICV